MKLQYLFLLMIFSYGCQTQSTGQEIKLIEDLVYNDGTDADPDKHKLDLIIPEFVDSPSNTYLDPRRSLVRRRSKR